MCPEVKPDVSLIYLETSSAGRKAWASVWAHRSRPPLRSLLCEPGHGTSMCANHLPSLARLLAREAVLPGPGLKVALLSSLLYSPAHPTARPGHLYGTLQSCSLCPQNFFKLQFGYRDFVSFVLAF